MRFLDIFFGIYLNSLKKNGDPPLSDDKKNDDPPLDEKKNDDPPTKTVTPHASK